MNLPSHFDQPFPSRQVLMRGAAVGLAGGLAEILVVGAYSRVVGVSAADTARGIATAAHLDGGSAATGLLVHVALAVLLGIALVAVATWTGFSSAGGGWTLATTIVAALGLVWAVNFLFVLPWLSPAFLALMPLPLALLSKLCFGVAGAITLHLMGLWQQPRSSFSASCASLELA